ncbi:UNVERIFIED_CONTAM: hypothetical protein PYX00_008128 [Menopon gallinae]|uniref:EMI domain-containing protein n=1 Tax=Menopon gallinae TaxID=328185 RepID=A0AAW2HLS5_9NEOP
MKLGVLCLMFVVAGSVRGVLSPAGENVCMYDEKYIDVIQVREMVPMNVYRVEWCWRIPPRCTVETQTMRPTLVSKKIPRVRIVPKCCVGYEEVAGEGKCVPTCSEPCLNGTCIAPDTCSCESGFHGNRCEKPCLPGTWGRGCVEKCHCYNEAACDGIHGHCECRPGWKGFRCEFPCEPGRYGPNCEERCNCYGELLCNHVSGECGSITESTTDSSAAATEETIFETETTETGDNSTESADISGPDFTGTSEADAAPKNTTHIEEIIIEMDHTTIIIDELVTNGPDIVHIYAEKVNEEEYETFLHPKTTTTTEDPVNNGTVQIEDPNAIEGSKTVDVEENEVESAKDFSFGVKKQEMNWTTLLENVSIISGVFILLFCDHHGDRHVRTLQEIEENGIRLPGGQQRTGGDHAQVLRRDSHSSVR